MYRAERYLEGYERAVVRIKAIKEQIKHLDETIDSINIATDGQITNRGFGDIPCRQEGGMARGNKGS